MNTNTKISRDEQITAIKVIAEEYESVSSITTLPFNVAIAMSDEDEAKKLSKEYRDNGWNVEMLRGMVASRFYVRVEINK